MDRRDERAIGPEMAAEGWRAVGADEIMWMHAPSRRTVIVDNGVRRDHCHVPCWGAEPASPSATGAFVACRTHDENGNPVFGDGFWTESYATALRIARRMRTEILAETPGQAKARRAERARRESEWLRDLLKRREPKP